MTSALKGQRWVFDSKSIAEINQAELNQDAKAVILIANPDLKWLGEIGEEIFAYVKYKTWKILPGQDKPDEL